MSYRVLLVYFRQTGKYLARAETTSPHQDITKIWADVEDMRRLGRLPGLRPNAGRDLVILVDAPDHHQRALQLVMPPFIDEDDVTPSRVPTEEMIPLVRVPLEEMPRTPPRDTEVLSNDDVTPEETTPVNVPMPEAPDDDS